MKVEITGDKYFFNTINFFKQQSNWQQIMANAAEKTAKDIEKDAKKKLYQYKGGKKNKALKKVTGGLENAMKVSVDVYEDVVDIGLGSDHPAAAIIEFGGYSPFPPWNTNYGEKGMPGRGYKGKLFNYLFEADTGVSYSFLLAKGIYDNQPFATPRPAMQNALREGLPKLNKQIWAEAKKLKP